jgi:hypothetical protein
MSNRPSIRRGFVQGNRKIENWTSKFARFIMAFGVENLARALDCTAPAVYHWIRHATTPRPKHAAMIQRLARESGVKLTLDQIYERPSSLEPITVFPSSALAVRQPSGLLAGAHEHDSGRRASRKLAPARTAASHTPAT